MPIYFVDPNKAGFHTLRLRNDKDEGSSMVMPLGINPTEAISAAINFVNQLNNPDAKLELPDKSKNIEILLSVKIPFKKHANETIAEVFKSDFDYLDWIYKTFNGNHRVIGKCWSALDQLARLSKSPFAILLKSSSTINEIDTEIQQSPYVGNVGEKIEVKIQVAASIPLKSAVGHGFYKISAVTSTGADVSFLSSNVTGEVLTRILDFSFKTQLFSITGVVNGHDSGKSSRKHETTLKAVKLVGIKCKTGLSLSFVYERSTTREYITNTLSALKPIHDVMVHSSEFCGIVFDTTTGKDKSDSSLLSGIAFYELGLLAVLNHSEINEIINSEDMPSIGGIFGISVAHAPILEH